MMRFYLFSLIFFLLFSSIASQAPIPHRPSGVVYPNSAQTDAPIVFEVFIDNLCPDCRAAWPVIKQVADHYGKDLRLLTHIFPLPYHTWSFTAAQGFQTVLAASASNATALYRYIDIIFDNQDLFGNDATSASSSNDVINLLASTVEKEGLLSAKIMTMGLNDPNINWNARVEWKYACSRSVLGTPTFLVNGVFVAGSASWQLSDWQTVLDPLLAPSAKLIFPSTSDEELDTQCPAGTTLCTYLPGKTECCKQGEFCILNVGCRC